MPSQKILQFVSYFPPHAGGMESHAAEWTASWIDAGYGEVMIVTSSAGQERDAGVSHRAGYDVCVIPCIEPVKNFPIPRFWDRRVWMAWGIMRDFHPDICITRTRFFPFSLLGGAFARIAGASWVHIEHGSDFVRQGKWWIDMTAYVYDQIFGRIIFLCADRIIAISEGVKGFVAGFVSEKRLADIPVVYRGVEFLPRSARTESDVIRFGFAGRLVNSGKGLDRALTLLSRIAREHVDLSWECRIAGDGVSRADYERMAQEFGISDRIVWLGHLDKTAMYQDFYPLIDILLNPSRTEWLPTTVIEALYNDCVVVATDVGGTREISNLRDLLLVPHDPFDPDILYGMTMDVSHSYQDRRGLSRDLMTSRFFWGESIREYGRILLW